MSREFGITVSDLRKNNVESFALESFIRNQILDIDALIKQENEKGRRELIYYIPTYVSNNLDKTTQLNVVNRLVTIFRKKEFEVALTLTPEKNGFVMRIKWTL